MSFVSSFRRHRSLHFSCRNEREREGKETESRVRGENERGTKRIGRKGKCRMERIGEGGKCMRPEDFGKEE
eukprot:1363501-Amorphochlora_amoeboformis.AAC.1